MAVSTVIPPRSVEEHSPAAMAWEDFAPGLWQHRVDVRDFIQRNYRPYTEGAGFLEGPSAATRQVWQRCQELLDEERKKGVLDVDTHTPSTITSHQPGYIDRDNERIVGLQTNAPLRRAIMPFGGIRMVEQSCEAYGYTLDPQVKKVFTDYRKTHNQGVFDAYTPEIRKARHNAIITGLPDAYGRGRIIGDYRRVALYGVDYLIRTKKEALIRLQTASLTEDVIRDREEIAEQIRSLEQLKQMAATYGYDLAGPARNATEAYQWLYFAYLGAVKQQNGAAMSLGRVSTFLDIYVQRDLDRGLLTEAEAQELADQFIIKLRLVRFLRTPEYDELFSGDPTWVTESLGGMGVDGRTLVTRNSYRFLQSLYNLGPAPEPNLTVLWSRNLPEPWKQFCTQVSIDTCAIQYENDDLMRPFWGDDYGIACCVSAMRLGKQMQFFGARANLAKALLYAINGGIDERTHEQVTPPMPPIRDEVLTYDKVMAAYDRVLDWLAQTYINALNAIHYMHDKYSYESLQMALHDEDVYRTMACGIAGLSVAADSLSAIKYAKVKPIRDDQGVAVDFQVDGEWPAYGNDDDRVDQIAVDLVHRFEEKLRRQPTYRHAVPTLSVLTITSNVVYGKKTGTTPDGRRAGEPFAPGANPMHGRDRNGAVASCNSVAKLPYADAQDGISYTFSIIPPVLGKTAVDRRRNLSALLDGYFAQGGHHININVLNRQTLLDAMDHPEKYPQLTIRVSGYAVNFVRLTREQQLEVVRRTFHEQL